MLFSAQGRWLSVLLAFVILFSLYYLLSASPYEAVPVAPAPLGNPNSNANNANENGNTVISEPPPAEQVPSTPAAPLASPLTEDQFGALFPAFKTYSKENPLGSGDFGELGNRVRLLRKYIEEAEKTTGVAGIKLMTEVEEVILALFPWLKNPSKPSDPTPLASLRKTFTPGSQAIVIPVGKGQFRFAAHLISGLRNVLESKLPIQIAFDGVLDLPKEYQDALVSLGPNIELLDVSKYFDDTDKHLELAGGWQIKPFAMLASPYEEVILIDADAAFFQDPAVMFKVPGYKETGTLLFHDRLLWQNVFKDRQKWWEKEMEHHTPSKAIQKSLVYTEGYAEEGDSGVMVYNKGRLDLVMALLHICWQNSKAPREEYTYKITYGDKESYWFGLELAGVEYTFEDHYGSIAGHTAEKNGIQKVCSFNIAHPDPTSKEKLLWYNGSLLKNKAISQTEFEVPTHWMADAEWEKGAAKADLSCMKHGEVREIPSNQVKVIERCVEEAKAVDESLKILIQSAASH